MFLKALAGPDVQDGDHKQPRENRQGDDVIHGTPPLHREYIHESVSQEHPRVPRLPPEINTRRTGINK